MAENEARKKLSFSEIEARASSYLHKHGMFLIPIDPVKIANLEGIKVNNAVFSDETLSGLIAKRGKNISILVNQSETPFRKRFTIAHELAHHFLHLTSEEDGDYVDNKLDLFRDQEVTNASYDENKKHEVEANQFAAALLMPQQMIVEYYRANPSLDEMARIFNVSIDAMGIRLNTLHLI